MLGKYLTNRIGQTSAALVVLLRLRRAQSSRKNEAAVAKLRGGSASYNPLYDRIESRPGRWLASYYVVFSKVVHEKNTRKYFEKNAGS